MMEGGGVNSYLGDDPGVIYGTPAKPGELRILRVPLFQPLLGIFLHGRIASRAGEFSVAELRVQHGVMCRTGVWATGAHFDGYDNGLTLDTSATYQYSGTGTEVPSLPLALAARSYTWAFDKSASDSEDLGRHLAVRGYERKPDFERSHASNDYGLHIISVLFPWTNGTFQNLNSGNTFRVADPRLDYFFQTDMPELEMVGFYFASETPAFNAINPRPSTEQIHRRYPVRPRSP